MHQEGISQLCVCVHIFHKVTDKIVMELDLGSWCMSFFASSGCVYFTILKKLFHSSVLHDKEEKIITHVVCSLLKLVYVLYRIFL